jgi:hypothetical protein
MRELHTRGLHERMLLGRVGKKVGGGRIWQLSDQPTCMDW